MKVKRIVSNVQAEDLALAKVFYQDILGLDLLIDQGWINTYGATETQMSIQISFMKQGGSGTPTPYLSIEVDQVDEAFERIEKGGFPIVYPLTNEPWGVRRFFTRDPFGKLINILAHL